MKMVPIIYNIDKWVADNQKSFLPPICNKLMYGDGQIKCFFVGGPNVRKDFHLEEGEEFFYMMKGDMTLVVEERKAFKNISIKEGEVFLLPARIAHSPQRSENTLGFVVERERRINEMDCLRYYVDGTREILYERWFHCEKLDAQLPPLIQGFFASEQFKTGKPIPGTILDKKPVEQDHERTLSQAKSLDKWIAEKLPELKKKGKVSLFDNGYSSRIFVLTNSKIPEDEDKPETFIWQLKGKATLKTEGKEYYLTEGNNMLIQSGKSWLLQNGESDISLSVVMNPANSKKA